MTVINAKIKSFLLKYRLLITIGLPFVFFIIFFGVFVSPASQPITSTSSESITPTVNINSIQGPENSFQEATVKDSPENLPGIQNKEVLQDNMIRYIYSSPNPNRPNILITRNGQTIVFQRTLTSPGLSIKITDYIESYGVAKWIFKGSVFYGPSVQTYIYPERGFAFIGNPTTGEVLEQHVFQPLKVEEYVSRYGEDIPAQP